MGIRKEVERAMPRKQEAVSYAVCCGDTATAVRTELRFRVDIWPTRDLPTGRAEPLRCSIIVIPRREGQQKRGAVRAGRVS